MQKQPLGALRIEEVVVDEDGRPTRDQPQSQVGAGVIVVPVPLHHPAQFPAVVAEPVGRGREPLVDAEALARGIVADVAGMDDHEILAMIRVRRVAVGGHLAADAAVIEGKGTEVLGDQDGRIALALIRTKGA